MKKIIFPIIAYLYLVYTKAAWADAIGTITKPDGFSLDANSLINKAVGLIMAVAGLIFLFMLLFGGIRFMTAGGDPKNFQSARGVIISALLGLVIVVGAYMVTGLIGDLLGIDFLHPSIPGLN